MLDSLEKRVSSGVAALVGSHPPEAWVILSLVMGGVVLLTIFSPIYADSLS
jgi:hypothetical protein